MPVPSPMGLVVKKGVVDVTQMVLGNPVAGILDSDVGGVVVGVQGGGDVEVPAGFHGLDGIEEQVEKALLQPVPVAVDKKGRRTAVHLEIDIL